MPVDAFTSFDVPLVSVSLKRHPMWKPCFVNPLFPKANKVHVPKSREWFKPHPLDNVEQRDFFKTTAYGNAYNDPIELECIWADENITAIHLDDGLVHSDKETYETLKANHNARGYLHLASLDGSEVEYHLEIIYRNGFFYAYGNDLNRIRNDLDTEYKFHRL